MSRAYEHHLYTLAEPTIDPFERVKYKRDTPKHVVKVVVDTVPRADRLTEAQDNARQDEYLLKHNII